MVTKGSPRKLGRDRPLATTPVSLSGPHPQGPSGGWVAETGGVQLSATGSPLRREGAGYVHPPETPSPGPVRQTERPPLPHRVSLGGVGERVTDEWGSGGEGCSGRHVGPDRVVPSPRVGSRGGGRSGTQLRFIPACRRLPGAWGGRRGGARVRRRNIPGRRCGAGADLRSGLPAGSRCVGRSGSRKRRGPP